MRTINERDWKVLRELHPVARDRFCQRVLTEFTATASDPTRRSHERYLAVWQLIRERDRQLADAFNDMRRSTALFKLGHFQQLDLLTPEEWTSFTPETREMLAFFRGEARP